MSTTVNKLRLGRLPKTETVKLVIAIPADVKASLDRYANLHSQVHGEKVDATALIPHMLVAFMERDRGFKVLNRKAEKLEADQAQIRR